MKEAVQKFLVEKEQRIEFMREGENHMEVRGINDFSPPFINPEFFKDRLAVRAIAVAAGIVVNLGMPAIVAQADGAAKTAGFAVHNRASSFLLNGRRCVSRVERRPAMIENLLYAEVTHKNLQSNQRD